MINYDNFPKHNVLCIDMKSFYASCECVLKGIDPLRSYLVVVGDKNVKGSIVLAASPKMKKEYGIKTGNRLFEVPRQSHIHIVEAKMAHYLNQSMQIIRLLNQFVPLEAIHTYSIDEFWICTNGTEKLWGDRWEVAKKIQEETWKLYGLPACIGIGPNKFLAKVILDIEAKKKGGIAECQFEDVSKKLWPQPIEKIWGIGRRMKLNLNKLGILTVNHLAHYSLEQLKKRFGIMGEQLYWHAWGIDLSPVTGYNTRNLQKGFGHGITLIRDYYSLAEIKTVILELCEEVARRAREAGMVGKTVSLGFGYSVKNGKNGFLHSFTIKEATNITMEIYEICLGLLHKNYAGEIVRSVNVSLTNLSVDKVIQLNLFEDKLKKHTMGYVVDKIRNEFGSTALLRATSLTDGGIIRERSKKIGGHKA